MMISRNYLRRILVLEMIIRRHRLDMVSVCVSLVLLYYISAVRQLEIFYLCFMFFKSNNNKRNPSKVVIISSEITKLFAWMLSEIENLLQAPKSHSWTIGVTGVAITFYVLFTSLWYPIFRFPMRFGSRLLTWRNINVSPYAALLCTSNKWFPTHSHEDEKEKIIN